MPAITTEQFLLEVLKSQAGFAQMMQDILDVLIIAEAKQASHHLSVEFKFDNVTDPIKATLEEFRQSVLRTKQMLESRPRLPTASVMWAISSVMREYLSAMPKGLTRDFQPIPQIASTGHSDIDARFRTIARLVSAVRKLWLPATPGLPSPLPWSPSEVEALTQLGVQLRDPARELKSLALQWLRPLLSAKKRFVLVCPPPGAEVHPIRQLLKKLVPDIESGVLDLDTALGSTLLATTTEVLAAQPIPAPPRRIQLSHPVQLGDTAQSFTTLNELFNDPALFVLKRVADLEPTSFLTVEEDNRLLGILAHRVFEKLFAHADALAWSNPDAITWFHTEADTLLQTEGAVLLMQGAGVSQQHFRKACEGAICSLLDHLRSAGATQVQTEVGFSGILAAVPLVGKIDLLVTLGDKRTVALDMKWRSDNYYAGLLRSGEHLQLALYSSLVEQTNGVAPAALGYFILESGAMYITAADAFPKAQVRRPPDGVTVATLLDRARATWNWRKQQLDAGTIDVVPGDPPDELQGPEGSLGGRAGPHHGR